MYYSQINVLFANSTSGISVRCHKVVLFAVFSTIRG